MLRTRIRLFLLLGSAFLLVFGACKKTNKNAKNKKKTIKRSIKKKVTKKVKKKVAKRPAPAGVHGEEVTYTSGKTTLKGYLAYDKSKKGKRPGVLVVHEWWGHNNYARKRARMLAKLGYVALALDMYGAGKNTGHPKDAKKFMMAVFKNMKEGENRFKAAKAVLEKHAMTDTQKIAAIGYCFGGAIVLHMARTGLALKGVASFHGNLKANVKAKKGSVKAEVLVLNGAADPFVSAKSIKAFKKEMKKLKIKYKFVNYPGAKHAFTNPEATAKGKKFKIPLAYQKEADEKSWAEMKTFFTRIFGS